MLFGFISFLLSCMHIRLANYGVVKAFRREKKQLQHSKNIISGIPFPSIFRRRALTDSPLHFRAVWPQPSANVAPLSLLQSFHVLYSHRRKEEMSREHSILYWDYPRPTKNRLSGHGYWTTMAKSEGECWLAGLANVKSRDTVVDKDRHSSGLWYASSADRNCLCLVSVRTHPVDPWRRAFSISCNLPGKLAVKSQKENEEPHLSEL